MFSRWMLDFKGEVLQHCVSGMFPILRAVIDKAKLHEALRERSPLVDLFDMHGNVKPRQKVDRYPTSKSAYETAVAGAYTVPGVFTARKAARKARQAAFKAGHDMPSSVADASVPSPVHPAAPFLDGDSNTSSEKLGQDGFNNAHQIDNGNEVTFSTCMCSICV
ncbi:hypothetical protein PG999_014322 [Apiospora kogelbergensis]|uniref:Uncharacterized protein n=1 Tax=Apiospora kogelbergensis TaxID=1337665 RepID=A0AAW0Q5J1_9PEZI